MHHDLLQPRHGTVTAPFPHWHVEIYATLQEYALTPATHHQTWHTGNCSGHQILLHRVSRLSRVCHVCSVWTGCHLWRDQGASGKSAMSAVLRGAVVPGSQHGSPRLDASPFTTLSEFVSEGLGIHVHRSLFFEVTSVGLAVLLLLSVAV